MYYNIEDLKDALEEKKRILQKAGEYIEEVQRAIKKKEDLILDKDNEIKELQSAISSIKDDCEKKSNRILNGLFERVIDRINKAYSSIRPDECPDTITAFDVLCFDRESKDWSEIEDYYGLHGMEDRIFFNYIPNEYKKLSDSDKYILELSMMDYYGNFCGGQEMNDMLEKKFNSVIYENVTVERLDEYESFL